MNNIPVGYEYINEYASAVSPSGVHTRNNALFYYYQRYLLQKAFSVFKWKLPKEWNKSYFLYTLYCCGFIAIFKTEEYGIIPQRCTFSGFNIYRAPVQIVATPLGSAKSYTRTIDKDCALLRLSPDYGSIMDIINIFADKLSLCSESADINLLNSHLAYVFHAKDKAEAETFKALYDQIAGGKPAVVYGKKSDTFSENSWETFSQNLKQNYIASDILEDMRKIENDFCTMIGLPNANITKKERMLTDEVNANNAETQCLASQWLEFLKSGCDTANRLFGLDLSVDWRFTESGVENNEIVGSGVVSV